RELAKTLSDWIDRSRIVTIKEIPSWIRLTETCQASPVFQTLQRALQSAEFHPVIYHGDFAPWNIKVSRGDGSWTALDWERGELLGFPCWDWFHFHIQAWILVHRFDSGKLITNIEK